MSKSASRQARPCRFAVTRLLDSEYLALESRLAELTSKRTPMDDFQALVRLLKQEESSNLTLQHEKAFESSTGGHSPARPLGPQRFELRNC